jgi:hypothetical protein
MPTCCAHPASEPRRPWPRRIASLIQWAIPAAALALIPKCPLCLAGYIALWTGLGISFTAASYLRGTLIALCLLSLGFLAATRVRRMFPRSSHP